MRWLPVVFLALLCALGSTQISAIPAVQYRVFRTGDNSKITDEMTRVMQTAGDADTYWKLAHGVGLPNGVDWSKQFLIAVHLGTRNTGGFKVFIESIVPIQTSNIRVNYVELTPSPNGLTTQALTSPWVVVVVERASAGGHIEFAKTSRRNPSQAVGGNWGTHFRVYACEVDGGGDRRREQVIDSQNDLELYWRAIFKESAPQGEIDWRSESLIAIHAGPQATTGYSLLMDWVEPLREGLGVRYVLVTPANGQRTKKSRTSPYILIRVPKFQGQAIFDRRTWTGEG